MNKKSYNMYEVIDRIRVKTGLYVGRVTTESVCSFLYGYDFAMKGMGIEWQTLR